MASDLFHLYWEELWDQWIESAQDEAKAKKRARSRGPVLKDVQMAIVAGEKGGARRYSRNRVDISQYEKVDFYARFLYRVYEDNTSDHDGLFFEKPLPRGEIEALL